MLTLSFKNKILILFIAFIFFIFFILDLNKLFTIEYLIENNKVLLNYVNNNFFISITLFYLIYLVCLFFFLPVSSIMIIFSTYFFDASLVIPINIIILAIGGLFNFVLLKKFNISSIFDKANKIVKKIENEVKKSEILYLLLLRSIPIPYAVGTAILVILKIPKIRFLWTTMLGVIPVVTIYSLAGLQLKELIDINNNIKIEDLINYKNFIILGLLILLIILSIYFKKKFK